MRQLEINLRELWVETENTYELEYNDILAIVYPVARADVKFSDWGWYVSLTGIGVIAETKSFDFKEEAFEYAEKLIQGRDR